MALAAATIGSGVLSAGSSLIGAGKASSAAKQASANNFRQYAYTRQDLSPFFTAGQVVVPDLVNLAQSGPTGGGPNYLTQAAGMVPGQFTQAELEATPGYQFTRDQGLKSVQSAAAARGLGVSGAALKGAADYSTGLANKTYLDQFNVANQRFQDVLGLNTAQQGNLTNQYNRLAGVAQLGSNAAAQTGTIGASLSNQAGNFLTQGGLASAAGTAGVGNAISGGLNNYLMYNAFQNALAGGSGGQLGGFVDNGNFTV
jgi:hypothetical protein